MGNRHLDSKEFIHDSQSPFLELVKIPGVEAFRYVDQLCPTLTLSSGILAPEGADDSRKRMSLIRLPQLLVHRNRPTSPGKTFDSFTELDTTQLELLPERIEPGQIPLDAVHLPTRAREVFASRAEWILEQAKRADAFRYFTGSGWGNWPGMALHEILAGAGFAVTPPPGTIVGGRKRYLEYGMVLSKP